MWQVYTRPTSASDFSFRKRRKRQFFFDFSDVQAPGATILRLEFQKVVELKLFVIMKDNFSAVAVSDFEKNRQTFRSNLKSK
jgi:hypothetical protein